MSAAQQHREHIEFARLCQERRAAPLRIELLADDLQRHGDSVHISVESDEGAPILIESPLVKQLARVGTVTVELEPLVSIVRARRDVGKRIDSKGHAIPLVMPCLYAFQDWLEAQPTLVLSLEQQAVAQIDLVTMRGTVF